MIRTPPERPAARAGWLALDAELEQLVAELRPSAVAVERVLFQVERPHRDVGGAGQRARARGRGARGIPVVQYSPNEVKLAVAGDGRADKAAVQTMVARLLGLARVAATADAADALTSRCATRGGPSTASAAVDARPSRETAISAARPHGTTEPDDRLGARHRARAHRDWRGARRGRRRRLPRPRCRLGALVKLGPGAPAFLFTHLHVREDAMVLFGFPTRDERDTFEALIGASGVGPKLALAILSVHPPTALRRGLADDDLDALVLVPGVGKRTAQRLLDRAEGQARRSRSRSQRARRGDASAPGRGACRARSGSATGRRGPRRARQLRRRRRRSKSCSATRSRRLRPSRGGVP